MADLRTLFPIADIDADVTRLQTLSVFSTSTSSPQNGGRCCLSTVPAGASWVRWEVWGGGSDGPGGCCCQQPAQTGGAGAYARKTMSVNVSDQFTICAAGSGCCAQPCCGTEGFPSFVRINGGGVVTCARGGPTSCSKCFHGYDSGCMRESNTRMCCLDSTFGADYSVCAISGSSGGGSCGFNSYQFVPEGPILGGGIKISRDYCQSLSGCTSIGGVATFPGGGGAGAVSNGGGCCWGGFGAGGLVIITWR